MKYPRLFLPGATLLALFICGCSSADKPAVTKTSSKAKGEQKLYMVSADSTAFFKHGPQSGREPDKTLPRNTIVKLIRPSFGFSKVEVADTGEQGYVSSEEIQPATSALIAATSAPKPNPLTTPSTENSVEQFNLNSEDPRLVPPPEALPPSELQAAPPEQ